MWIAINNKEINIMTYFTFHKTQAKEGKKSNKNLNNFYSFISE